METCTIEVSDMGDKTVKFTLRTDLSPNVIQEVMDKPLRILQTTGNVVKAMIEWNLGIAERVIIQPREYRDNPEKIEKIPSSDLFDKINELYTLREHIPPEYREPAGELFDRWDKMIQDWIKTLETGKPGKL